MTEEEYLRKRMNMIELNSHYGIMVDTEITKIVRDHIKRLEEATMHADCEFCIKRNICTRDVPKPCKYRYTEEERIADQASDRVGAILHNTYLHPTFRKKKEENTMKATSKQEIKNIRDISFSFVSCPIEMKSELTVTATTDDDIFEFVFEGEHIIEGCEKSGMFIGWETYRKIRKLEAENKQLKKEYEKKLDDLKHKYDLECGANEAQHKFIREYTDNCAEVQFNYAIDDAKEVSYVVVDKESYQYLKDKFNEIWVKWANAQSENAPASTSRADILDQAKKCVCGQREQDYGSPESNFQLIADLWNDYLKKKRSSIVVDATDVAMMMALLKIARIRNGGGSGDSFVDLAGYAACGGEIWAGEKKQKDQN